MGGSENGKLGRKKKRMGHKSWLDRALCHNVNCPSTSLVLYPHATCSSLSSPPPNRSCSVRLHSSPSEKKGRLDDPPSSLPLLLSSLSSLFSNGELPSVTLSDISSRELALSSDQPTKRGALPVPTCCLLSAFGLQRWDEVSYFKEIVPGDAGYPLAGIQQPESAGLAVAPWLS